MSDIRQILESLETETFVLSEETLPLLYDELRSLAAGYMSQQAAGQTLQPTALVHEAWLRLSKEDGWFWNSRAHFFRTAAQAMRHILVDRARAKARLKRGANAEALNIETLNLAGASVDEKVLLVDEILTQLERENPAIAQVVSLKFFSGLGEKEIAAMNGVAERTVRRQWSFAKARLFQMLRSEFRVRSDDPLP